MSYSVREGIVCRDIAGVYFAVDIHDKHFYRNKQINCLNEIAYTLLTIMQESGEFTAEDIAEKLEDKLSKDAEVPHERILSDVSGFIAALEERGWVVCSTKK